MKIWMIILIKFYCFQKKMSLALLKKELETASHELTNSNREKSKKKNVGDMILGTERHGMKKKMQKLKSKKSDSAKYAFKFAEESSAGKVDRTKDCLKKLAMLDRIGKSVSASKIIEDTVKRKRQMKPDNQKKRKEEDKSLFLTDEEVAAIEKEYFLHSKNNKKSKSEDWRD